MRKMKKLSKGFTMIELLIVIAVLGILAVAVLSAINPIEQINRGKDTGTRSDAEQLLSAIDRYYTSKGYYPWVADSNSLNTAIVPLTRILSSNQVFGGDGVEMLTNLSAGGTAELKASFISRIVSGNVSHLWLYHSGVTGESTYLCFIPKSASFREAAYGRCTQTADYGNLPLDYPPEACPEANCTGAAGADGATGCYSCLP